MAGDPLARLDALDKAWLLAVNGAHAPFLDGFMAAVTDKWVWVPFYLLLIFLVVRRYGRWSIVALLAVVLTITLADQWASGFCKPFFARFRPGHCPELEGLVRHVIGRGDKYGFMSSHAANTMGLAVITSLFFRSWPYTCLLVGWSALNMYSRVYLGMHYPFDVLCGAACGGLIGWGCYVLAGFVSRRVNRGAADVSAFPPVSGREWGAVGAVLVLTLAGCAAYAVAVL